MGAQVGVPGERHRLLCVHPGVAERGHERGAQLVERHRQRPLGLVVELVPVAPRSQECAPQPVGEGDAAVPARLALAPPLGDREHGAARR